MATEKITVLLVDDERLAIEDLCSIVDWQAHGFEIVATAFNGSQAFNKFMQYRPQVVITDIKMPIMDGITLIQKIRQVDQQTLILLLSAYEDFSYARTAIQMQSTDYIIKSEITAQNMHDLLLRLQSTVEKRKQNHAILTDTMFEAFFTSPNVPIDVEEELIMHRCFAFLLVEQSSPLMIDGGQKSASPKLPQAELKRILRSLNYREMRYMGSISLCDCRTLLVLEPQDHSMLHTFDGIYANALMMQEILRKQERNITFFLCMRPMSLYDFRSYLASCDDLFALKWFSKNTSLIIMERCKRQKVDVPVKREEWLELLKQGQGAEAAAYLNSVFNALIENRDASALLKTSQMLYSVLLQLCTALPDSCRRPDLSAAHGEDRWTNASGICAYLTEKAQEFCILSRQKREYSYSRTVLDAISYVNIHYSDSELSLNEIADSLHISVGYLCMLFKKEVGTTLNNHITDVRIREAKRMLRHGHEKIYEISTAVGYQTSQYFSQVFQKRVGMYPAEYRKRGGTRREKAHDPRKNP